ncbi:MAG: zinc ribbon domain-containing protein, partial [Nannocystaceae bacterium]
MSAPIPCPCCGSDIGPQQQSCGVCGQTLGSTRTSNAGGSKCARCGAMLPTGFDFCPVCGQGQQQRFHRHATQQLHIGGHAPPPSRSGASVDSTNPTPLMMPPGGSIDRTVPAPSSGPTPRPPAPSFSPPIPPSPAAPHAGNPPRPAPVDRTVPAPSASRPSRPPMLPSSGSLVDAVVDAQT